MVETPNRSARRASPEAPEADTDHLSAYAPPLGLLLAGYALAAILAVLLGRVLRLDGPPSIFWPGTGLLLGVLLLTPIRHWPSFAGIALAVELAVGFAFRWATGVPMASGLPLYFALADVAVPVGIAMLLRGRRSTLLTARRVMTTVAKAALVCAAGALVAAAGLSAGEPTGALLPAQLWWTADMLGVIAVAPAVTTLWLRRFAPQATDQASAAELAGLVLAAAAVMMLVFGNPPDAGLWRSPFILVPVLFWAAVRFRPPLVAVLNLAVAIIASVSNKLGLGPFHGAGIASAAAALPLQFFLLVVLTSSFTVSVAIEARRLVQARYMKSERALRAAIRRVTDAEESARREVARELHDMAAQSAVGARLLLDRILRAPLPQPLHVEALAVSLALEQVEAELDRVTRKLAPPALVHLGLEPALASLVESFRGRGPLRVELLVEGAVDRLPPSLAGLVYRWVSELLTNVVKHAQATLATVRVGVEEERLVVTVQDNGSGFIASAPKGRAAPTADGLAGVRDRAVALGGSVSIEPAPDAGCAVRIVVPWMEANNEGDGRNSV
jgi:two-component system sensor histidine kinase UhpB